MSCDMQWNTYCKLPHLLRSKDLELLSRHEVNFIADKRSYSIWVVAIDNHGTRFRVDSFPCFDSARIAANEIKRAWEDLKIEIVVRKAI